MADQPHVTITALGNSRSGKTTFLLGMYAVMSAGLQGYFLNAPDQDVDLDLAGKWERLLDRGELPPPNPGDVIPYYFDFLDGIQRLLGVDWLDYRGGALDDVRGTESGDVPKLHERIARSDSIYLVLDGSYLADPVNSSTKFTILRRAGLRRMTALLQAGVQQRLDDDGASPPSIVVLITKADLVPRQRRSRMDEIVADVQTLLPICFSTGFSTLVCPVQLGEFGLQPPERISTEDIAPRALHKPIIFSLAEYMRLLSIAAGNAESQSESQQQAIATEISGLRSGAGAFFRRSAIREAETRLATAIDERGSLSDVQKFAADRASRLFDELSGLPLFRDGHEVTA